MFDVDQISCYVYKQSEYVNESTTRQTARKTYESRQEPKSRNAGKNDNRTHIHIHTRTHRHREIWLDTSMLAERRNCRELLCKKEQRNFYFRRPNVYCFVAMFFFALDALPAFIGYIFRSKREK